MLQSACQISLESLQENPKLLSDPWEYECVFMLDIKNLKKHYIRTNPFTNDNELTRLFQKPNASLLCSFQKHFWWDHCPLGKHHPTIELKLKNLEVVLLLHYVPLPLAAKHLHNMTLPTLYWQLVDCCSVWKPGLASNISLFIVTKQFNLCLIWP